MEGSEKTHSLKPLRTMTFQLSYRQLQQVLNRPENTVKRNSKGDVLRAEVQRLLREGVLSTEYLARVARDELRSLPAPTPAGKTRTKFDWQGLATDRKHAIKLLKAARDLGHKTVKLNAPNVDLLAALRDYLAKRDKAADESLATSSAPTKPTKTRPTTRPATIATIPTLTVKTKKPELTQLETERAECKKLLQARESLEIQLCIKPDDATLQERLTECKARIHDMPARAFC